MCKGYHYGSRGHYYTLVQPLWINLGGVPMNFLSNLFGARKAIHDVDELTRFIDENAAFVVQKGIYEYARARAGHYSKVLFGEAGFQRTVEVSRWRAYPLGLAMVSEVATAALQEKTDLPREKLLRAVADLALAAFDGFEDSQVLGAQEWSGLRAELARNLDRIGLHPPKRAMDVPEPFAEAYFSHMPIHESLRAPDFPTMRNYLRVTLCNVQDELAQRIDGRAMSSALSR